MSDHPADIIAEFLLLRDESLTPDEAGADERVASANAILEALHTAGRTIASPGDRVVKAGEGRKADGAIRGLERIKADFKMRGANATTIERAIAALRTLGGAS